MKAKYLFPYRFKWISGAVFFISLILLIVLYVDSDVFSKINPDVPVFAIAGTGEAVFETVSKSTLFQINYFTFIYNNILDEILFFLIVFCGLIFAFSKERTEDEMVMKIRLDSLAWAIYFNYIILLFCYLFFYGFSFLNVLVVAMLSNLLFFITRFRWAIYKYNKIYSNEK